ncbi:MAG: DUF1080 domain-containing protein [Planctomycetes bacterium]|nr:DUF1080 domain-containing protein [Planctomycetota bacterium]NOG55864.1 DUF1080 domain-containing protein [Planctomycetota bacterium]
MITNRRRLPLQLACFMPAALICAAVTAPLSADVTLPSVLSDGMVLQQQRDAVPIWGRASAGEQIQITADWLTEPVTTTADARGRWSADISTPDADMGSHQVRIVGNNTLVLSDVLIGEVWICSGQSNMEWPMRACGEDAEIGVADYPQIRLFNVQNTVSAHERDDCTGQWLACNSESLPDFSGVAYFFGSRLFSRLRVPIGLIQADWGGTRVEAWMSEDALSAYEQYKDSLDILRDSRDPLKRGSLVENRREQWWTNIDRVASMPGNWTTVAYDDSEWKSHSLPGSWAGDGLDNHDGILYYRKTIKLSSSLAGRRATLTLGPIDDYDDAWVNGKHVAATHEAGKWSVPREYDIMEDILVEGDNVICVRVLDTGGLGGFGGEAGQMQLKFKARQGESQPPASLSLAGAWKWHLGPTMSQLPAMPESTGMGPNTVTALFNGMISPIEPYGIRGAIWYQGESNRGNAAEYHDLFSAMIRNWRDRWGQGDFPFYFVQIAPFMYGGDRGQTALLRESQRLTMSTVDNTGMVVTTDIGNPADIHPRNKREVGRRLSLWALSQTYGIDEVVPSGPLYKSMTFEEHRARITFDYAADRLVRKGNDHGLTHFLIAGADKQFRSARAVVDPANPDSILVWNDRITEPVAVRFAWTASPLPNFFNSVGLPASPFRTDDWNEPLPRILNDEQMSTLRDDDPAFGPLFNGTDLDGWHNVNCAPSTWSVRADENGDPLIACTGIPTGLLRTDRQYENFVLELEWRHLQPGGNAGLFVWSDALTAKGQPFSRSVEVQVMDGAEGAWFTSDGDIFPIHGATMTPITRRGRGSSRAFPSQHRANPSPMWNHYRVICNNGNISLAVNGLVVTKGKEASPRKGYICLEAEGSPVEFRNIRIKEMPPADPPLAANQVAAPDMGFVPMYTGVDFSGWKYGPEHEGHWRATNWTVTFDGQGADLWTEKEYTDFVMICDWRWTGEPKDNALPVILPSGENKMDENGQQVTQVVPEAGDSGIYLRGNSKSQVNIWCWPIGSGEVYGYRTDGSMSAEVKAGVTPSEPADAPIGQWNRFIIKMVGDRLTVVLNGKTVLENAQLPGVPESGPIALQHHGGALQFANLYIKEL